MSADEAVELLRSVPPGRRRLPGDLRPLLGGELGGLGTTGLDDSEVTTTVVLRGGVYVKAEQRANGAWTYTVGAAGRSRTYVCPSFAAVPVDERQRALDAAREADAADLDERGLHALAAIARSRVGEKE